MADEKFDLPPSYVSVLSVISCKTELFRLQVVPLFAPKSENSYRVIKTDDNHSFSA